MISAKINKKKGFIYYKLAVKWKYIAVLAPGTLQR